MKNLQTADTFGEQSCQNNVRVTKDMSTAELNGSETLTAEFGNQPIDGAKAVPLLISRRDPVTAPLRHAANEKKARIQRNPTTLSEGQRRNALEMLRQQTEVEMRRALGDRNFNAFKAFNQWWFRELCAGN